MALMELHKRKGHAGYMPGCPVCLMCRKNVRKRHAVKDPPTERRVGYRWSIDALTWPVRSRDGDRYTLVLRDYASGYYIVLHVGQKSDSRRAVERAVSALRSDPRFKDPDRGYELVSELHLDPAGEWRDDNTAWREMCERLGIHSNARGRARTSDRSPTTQLTCRTASVHTNGSGYPSRRCPNCRSSDRVTCWRCPRPSYNSTA